MKKLITLILSLSMILGTVLTVSPAAALEADTSLPTPFIDQDAEGIDGNLRELDGAYFKNVIAGTSGIEYSPYANREFNFTATQYKQNTSVECWHFGQFNAAPTSNDVTISTWINMSDFVILNKDARGTRIFTLRSGNQNADEADFGLEVRKEGTLYLKARAYDEKNTSIGTNINQSDGKYRWPMTWSSDLKYANALDTPTGAQVSKDDIDSFIAAHPGESESPWMLAQATIKYDEANRKMIYNVYLNGEHIYKDVEMPLKGEAAPKKITQVQLNTWGGVSAELKKYARLKMYNGVLSGEQLRSIYDSEKSYFVASDAPAFSLGFNNSDGIINTITKQPMTIYEYKYGNDVGKVAKATASNKYTGESYKYVDIESYSHFYTDADFISDTDMTLEFWWHVPPTQAGDNAMATISRGAERQPAMSLRFGPDGNIVLSSAQTDQSSTTEKQIFSKGALITNPTPRQLAQDTTLERPWHHIAVTRSYDSSSKTFSYRLFFNGTAVANGTEALGDGVEPMSNEGLIFGLNMLRGTGVPHTKDDNLGQTWSQPAGFMDVKVYNRALNGNDIYNEYSSKTAILADTAEFKISDIAVVAKNRNIPMEDLSEVSLGNGDGKAYGKASYVNYTGEAYTVLPVLAAYDADGALQKAVVCDKISISSAYGEGKIETSDGIEISADTKRVTLFMLDGIDTLSPHTEATSVYQAVAPLNNSMTKLNGTSDEKARVLFIGGSITAGNGATSETGGYAKLTGEWLKSTYGATYTISALGGTGSDLANARISYLMDTHTPDIVFVEYAVNDSCNAVDDDGYKYYQKSTEGIVRTILEKNPNADIILVNTMHKYMYEDYYDSGKLHPTILAKDEIARAFDLGLVNVGKQAAMNVLSGSAAWADYFGTDNCHPNDGGATQYADTIKEYVERAVSGYNSLLVRSAAPANAVNRDGYYFKGSLAPIANASGIESWTKGSNQTDGHYLYTTRGADSITYTFSGNGIGIFSGSRLSGTFKCKIDGGDEIEVDGGNNWYKYIKTDLSDGQHTIEIYNGDTTKAIGFNSFLILNKQ